jgi:cell division protein FtsL
MTDTPTTPPYSGVQSSSTLTSSQPYIQPLPLEVPQNKESMFNFSGWTTMLVGMILTAIIGYFSSLIAVNSDIAENRKDISVAVEKVVHITTGLSDLKKDLNVLNRVQRKTDELSIRVNVLENNLEKHSSHPSLHK